MRQHAFDPRRKGGPCAACEKNMAAHVGIATKRACEIYRTGTGQEIHVHPLGPGCVGGCVIHAPSKHAMSGFPTNWRHDSGIMERICPHGIGHPDPDGIAHIRKKRGRTAAETSAVHGCDGCCGVWPERFQKKIRDWNREDLLASWEALRARIRAAGLPDPGALVLTAADVVAADAIAASAIAGRKPRKRRRKGGSR